MFAFILCNFHDCKLENAYVKHWNALSESLLGIFTQFPGHSIDFEAYDFLLWSI